MAIFGMTALMLALAISGQSVISPSSEPMAIFSPYVGNWSCAERITGKPVRVSEFRFDLDHDLLREVIVTPESRTEPQGEATSATFGFNAKTGGYVEIEMISGGRWYVSTAKTPHDGSFHWVDAATSETPSRWDMTLPQRVAFDIQSFSRPQDKSPSYRASCKRSPGKRAGRG